MAFTIYILLVISTKSVLTYNFESFTEELLIKPLYSNQLYAHFQFTTKWETEISSEECKLTNKNKQSILFC